MKKTMSAQALKKEAAFWKALKEARLNPGMACHK